MNYLDKFKPEKINSIPAIRQSLKILKDAIDGREIGNYPPEGGVKFEDLTEELQHSLPKYIETTYSELKSLRDNSQLIPGCWYRITDYECTTAQENTKSAGHSFDILVLATSVNSLSEEAKAVQHEGDYDGVFIDDGDHYVYTGRKVIIHFTDVTKELYLWHLTIDNNVYTGFYSELSLEELKQLTQEQLNETLWIFNDSDPIISENEIETDKIYSPIVWSDLGVIGYSFDSYFANFNLNAWKIWYSLDNDTSRFAWAYSCLYPAYISTPDILDGEHLEFQGITYVNGNPELNYGTSEQSIRYGEGYTSYAGGFVLRDYASDKSFVGENIDNIRQVIEDNEARVGVVYLGGIDEPLPLSSENVSEESVADEGKGVIYRMIDEWNNDCPYDFKNIMFKRWQSDDVKGLNCTMPLEDDYCTFYSHEDSEKVAPYSMDPGSDVTAKYLYTFSKISNDDITDASISNNAVNNLFNNKLSPHQIFNGYDLNNVVFSRTDNSALCDNKCYNCQSCTIISSHRCKMIDAFNVVVKDSYNIDLLNGSNLIFYNCNHFILDAVNSEEGYAYVRYATIGKQCNDIIVNGSANKGVNTLKIFDSCYSITIDDYVINNITIVNAGRDGITINSNKDNVWVGVTTDDNVRYWNPADPSGT